MSMFNSIKRIAGLVSELDDTNDRLASLEASRGVGMVVGLYKLVGLGVALVALKEERDKLKRKQDSLEKQLEVMSRRLADVEGTSEVSKDLAAVHATRAERRQEAQDRQQQRAVDAVYLNEYTSDGRWAR